MHITNAHQLVHLHKCNIELRHILARYRTTKRKRDLPSVICRFEPLFHFRQCVTVEDYVVGVAANISSTQFAWEIPSTLLTEANAIVKLYKWRVSGYGNSIFGSDV